MKVQQVYAPTCVEPDNCEKNPSTGNPHPSAGDEGPPGTTEIGNPHLTSPTVTSCSGNPHGEGVGGLAANGDQCPGSR
jgi:hypothetical protein